MMGHVPTLFLRIVLLFVSSFVLASESPRITHKVFLDMEIGKEKIGRIELGLYGEIVPKTVHPFRSTVDSCRSRTSELWRQVGMAV
jgi:hypothetical protein